MLAKKMSDFPRKIPNVLTELDQLRGTVKCSDLEFEVEGRVYFDKSRKPMFEGSADTVLTPHNTSEMDLELSDDMGHSVQCKRVRVNNISNHTKFRANVSEVLIASGEFQEKASLHVFDAAVIQPFFGAELDFIKPGTCLYGDPIKKISKECNGYLYTISSLTDLDQHDSRVDKLSWILSFAAARFVSFPWQGVWNNDESIYRITFRDSIKHYNKTKTSIFNLTYPGILQNYLERAWPTRDKYKGQLDVPALIDFYVLLKEQRHIETIMLIGSVWMEAIKYQYAKNFARYEQNKGGYFLKPNTKAHYNLKELMEKVYDKYKIPIQNRDFGFIPYRNKVIHQGKIDSSIQDQSKHYKRLIRSIESILLSILEYEGKIWDDENKKYLEFPPR